MLLGGALFQLFTLGLGGIKGAPPVAGAFTERGIARGVQQGVARGV